MMFKGTARFGAGVLDKAIDRVGGQWNAFTSSDYTMYYETLPAQHIALALEAEADRMTNARFDPADVASERTVIISERQGNENRPTFWLGEQMRATIFRVHGYRHEIIGDLCDLETMTRDDLYTHYRRHYTPSNAVAVAVGAFDTATMLDAVRAHYEGIPSTATPSLFNRPEPPQMGERRVIVERPLQTKFVRVAFRAPHALADDWFSIAVLDSVLTGVGGAIDNKTTRLYQALVKTGLCASVSGGLHESIDPYIYAIATTLNEGTTHERAERVILEAIERVQQDGITPEELARAQRQAQAAFAYGTESVTNQAYWLAQSAMLGDVNWLDDYMARLQRVTLADVQRVAQKYLVPRQRTVGWLVPQG
jgi:zinc protease